MTFDSTAEARVLFEHLGIPLPQGDLVSHSPIDGRIIGSMSAHCSSVTSVS